MYPPKPWTEILPRASDQARDLVSRLVVYESCDRITPKEVSLLIHGSWGEESLTLIKALEHPFFDVEDTKERLT